MKQLSVISFLMIRISLECTANIYKPGSGLGDLLPIQEYPFISELEGVELTLCVMLCTVRKPGCVGVFYQKARGCCKLINSQNETLEYETQTGWVFWTDLSK